MAPLPLVTVSLQICSPQSLGKSDILPCIQKKGKELVPTAFGAAMIDGIHESLTKPDLTAVMEYNLTAIAEGKMNLGDFLEETQKMVLENIAFAEGSSQYMATIANVVREDQEVPHEECPVCRRKTLARKYSPKTNCPQCGVPLCQVYSKKMKQQYWICPKCNEFKKML